jgi:hypothetical protein
MSEGGEDIHKEPARHCGLNKTLDQRFSIMNKCFVSPKVVKAIRSAHDLRPEQTDHFELVVGA